VKFKPCAVAQALDWQPWGTDISRAKGINFDNEASRMDLLIFRAMQSQVADGHGMWNGEKSKIETATLGNTLSLVVFAPQPNFKFATKLGLRNPRKTRTFNFCQ